MSERNYWTSLRHRKISRRTMLKASSKAGVGAAGLALVGCGGDDDDDDAATAATEQAEEQVEQAQAQAQAEEQAEEQAQAQAEQAMDDEQAEEQAEEQAVEAEEAEFSQPWPLDQVDLDASIVAGISSRQEGTDMQRAGSQGNVYSHGAVFNAAMEIDPVDGSAIPSLAAPEWIDPVTLRATVEPAPFHDGSILTAHDMVFSYDRMGGRAEYHQGGETTDHPGGWTPTNPTRGAESWVRNEAVDDRTWSFELAGPDGGFFPVNLARVGEVAIVSQADVEGRGDAAVDQAPMGTGPYRFVSQTADENSVFERFEDHFLPVDYPVTVSHYAHNKHLTVVLRPELQSRLAGLEAGEIDLLESLGPDVVAPFVDDPEFTVQFERTGQLNIYINLWQQTMDDGSPNPFLDLRVRQAANHAINRQALIDNLLLGVGQQSMFAFSGIGGYPTAEQKQEVLFDYDPERARALMAEAGYADGFDVPLYIAESAESVFGSFGPDMALAVEQELNAVGIRAELRQIPISEYFTDAYTRGRENAPPGLFFFGANTVPDVGSMWECCTGPDGFFTLSPPLDPSLDELYQALKVETDAERRTEMVTQLLVEHARQAYFIFLVEPPRASLTAADVNWPLGGPFGRLNGRTAFAAQRHV
ncbi:MAG: ABC-type transport system, substrate-binding protein [Chloroflexi bacterium]|nr:MAG: ABC-type transport system, substrate-binding protein [Chloroflexota bacterium]